MEISLDVALVCLISGTDKTDVAETVFHGYLVCTLVSCYVMFRFIHI